MNITILLQPPSIVYNDPRTATFCIELSATVLPSAPLSDDARAMARTSRRALRDARLSVTLRYADTNECVANQNIMKLKCKTNGHTAMCCADHAYDISSWLAPVPSDCVPQWSVPIIVHEVTSAHDNRPFLLHCAIHNEYGNILASTCTNVFIVRSKDPAKRRRGPVFAARQAVRAAQRAARLSARDANRAAQKAQRAATLAHQRAIRHKRHAEPPLLPPAATLAEKRAKRDATQEHDLNNRAVPPHSAPPPLPTFSFDAVPCSHEMVAVVSGSGMPLLNDKHEWHYW